MYGECFHLVSQRMQRECSANGQRLLASIRLAFTFQVWMSIRQKRMRSANAWLMFSECMATANLHMYNSFRRMYGECMATYSSIIVCDIAWIWAEMYKEQKQCEHEK